MIVAVKRGILLGSKQEVAQIASESARQIGTKPVTPIAQLTPNEYAIKFLASQPSGPFRGVCGRFIRGVRPADFLLLSDEPGKKLSWICDEELLQQVCGKNGAEAMVIIGHGLDWLENRLHDGTSHKLVLFPSTGATNATWDGVFELIRLEFGEAVHQRLAPHHDALKCTPYSDIDPDLRLKSISDLSVLEKLAHPEYLTAERFLALKTVGLYHARGFLHHAIGCNQHYTGNGCSPDGQREYMIRNQPIENIEGALVLDLAVTATDIEALRRRYPTRD
jgi:hypothetical protein